MILLHFWYPFRQRRPPKIHLNSLLKNCLTYLRILLKYESHIFQYWSNHALVQRIPCHEFNHLMKRLFQSINILFYDWHSQINKSKEANDEIVKRVVLNKILLYILVGDEMRVAKDCLNDMLTGIFYGGNKVLIVFKEMLFEILKYLIQKYKLFWVFIFLENQEVLEGAIRI